MGTHLRGPSSIWDGVGGKEKDSWLSKQEVKGINKERGIGKTILVRKKSKCKDV